MKQKENNGESGQMMLLMVIVIAAVALAAMAFSSFTVISELRQVTDARLSGAALFAADTGIECILFKEFGSAPYGEGCPTLTGDACDSGETGTCEAPETELFAGGPKFSFQLVSRRKDELGRDIVVWKAIGKDASGRAVRSLQITLIKL
ncbi:MAG: hypothetical protein WC565_03695 [Parcubacteria group bacterium]